eukprot:TRINITY_DN1205_c0_g1_i1.p1 TRINITY_DN1205_c0_g1~~TRINITY_DN1205_c0_g1_i1.p1  ORF type:complete len:250 (-),score=44.25 TRINITY_DN1205_c0_g1_i1:49-798(-)
MVILSKKEGKMKKACALVLLLAVAVVYGGYTPKNACTDAADKQKVSNFTTVKSELTACAAQCYFTSPFDSCTSACMVTKAGLSTNCASCFGADASCTKTNCPVCLSSPSGSACQSCSSTNCTPAFKTCSGVSPSDLKFPSPANGVCTDSADKAKLANTSAVKTQLTSASASCFLSSTFQSCVSGKMAGWGLTTACAQCFGTDAYCTKSNCASECISAPSSSACLKCSNQHCTPAFDQCSGLSWLAEVIA